MSLEKLADELEETAQQSARMAGAIAEAVAQLSTDMAIRTSKEDGAISRIVVALQAQDRFEQRCRNLARAAREMAEVTASDEAELDAAWRKLELGELTSEEPRRRAVGEVELF